MTQKDADVRYFGVRRGHIEIAIIITLAFTTLAFSGANATEVVVNTSNNSVITVNDTAQTVAAIENITANATTVTNQTPAFNFSYENQTPRRINQGDCVQPGERIDIAGVGWYSGLIAYYGRYYDGYSGAGNTSITAIYTIEARDLDSLYIDPAYFALHKGWWYNYDPVTDANGNSHGYDRLFYIADTCALTPKENTTAVAEAMNESKRLAAIRANMSKMSQKTIPGVNLIVSKNTTTAYSAPENTHYWIFGKTDDNTNYDVPLSQGNQIVFEKNKIDNLQAAVYDVVFVSPGNNSILEETYNKSANAIVSPFVSGITVSLKGITPTLAEPKLIERINASIDDTFSILRVSIQDPSVEISQLTQTPINENKSYVVVAGYTNANAGSDIIIQMDADSNGGVVRKGATLYTNAINNGGGGAYRTWNTSFIADYDILYPGSHEITVTADNGGVGKVPIYIRTESPANAHPPDVIHFIDNSPFIPVPTPIVIHDVQTVTVTRDVPYPVPPTDEQVKAQQKIIIDGYIKLGAIVGVIALIFLTILYKMLKWFLSIYRRTIA